MAAEIDWDALHARAVEACAKAYVPYSRFPVGASALVDDGRVVSGANIENASYGITLCAECSLVSELVMGGGGRLVAFACVDGDGDRLMPCGRCRQLLFEHAAPGMLLDTVSGIRTIEQVLPDAFGARELEAYAGGRPGQADTAQADTAQADTGQADMSQADTSQADVGGADGRG